VSPVPRSNAGDTMERQDSIGLRSVLLERNPEIGGPGGSDLLAMRLSLHTPRLPSASAARPARRLGKPVFDFRGRGELLALTYSLGGLAVAIAWAVDPRDITNRVGMTVLLVVVFTAAAAIYGLRRRLPHYADDVAIVGSLALIDVGSFFTNLHVHPGLLSPFYIWVGFASPLWFPRRRAVLYALLAVVASGVVILVAHPAQAVAGWLITMATLVVAFCITSFLTDALVKREKLAVVGEMASAIGHELRNPLGAVMNAVFLLRLGLQDDISHEQELQLQVAEREISKADAILNELGAYVRPGRPVVSLVYLEALVAEVLEVAPPSPDVRVTVDVAPVALLADRRQLAQILTNLVTNSYDAVGEAGSVRVAASIKGRTVIIVVEDDGTGIDRTDAERIFEPFYTSKPSGTGLGLAIVRRLVEGHGGSIRLDTESSGRTRFVVRLPYRKSQVPTDRIDEPGGLVLR
jgi:signal transduction histidine kinase